MRFNCYYTKEVRLLYACICKFVKRDKDLHLYFLFQRKMAQRYSNELSDIAASSDFMVNKFEAGYFLMLVVMNNILKIYI